MVNQKYVVGLMSGTSLDGIDAALVSISEEAGNIEVRLIQFTTLPYSDVIRGKILQLCDPKTAHIEDISAMNMLLGELFADAAQKVVVEANMTMREIDMISSHGQTIFHQPENLEIDGHQVTSTLQIGDIAVIAERTGVMTIGDFRTRDMAAGGQGAPLVPYADNLLFREENHGRVLVNIGGIANITVLPPKNSDKSVLAFDTGPGNMIIDAFTTWATNGVKTFDENGDIAANGQVHENWLNELLSHEFFKQSPPKSTGREQFGMEYARKLWDQMGQLSNADKIATITELTSRSLAADISRFIEDYQLKEVFISGGGWHNHTLRNSLKSMLPDDITIDSTDALGIQGDAKEAVVFALLGYQCSMKRSNNLPSATGATKPVVMGKVAF
ncbi:anhydro-N-acetylmuramic acid kinase [Fredinandcohnia quinoae]|uniref:Anhydro-N-acetylmuramic acid kinase n=1 Tax=Fredinandcohnia quinoae TaxID=2918902 RepID=A0AAW5EA02_9BACI|nr:anhydro-N-acetylmuramic acid kinase [Fredinandcohnia sp. SECRCQ15]MCH1625953.1 anhydro-N-acetylmuramic acid kinase [Fredinandcohnia sp. SECRCQ15]